MIINKDNVTDYQVSHIDSTHEERLEVCRILESFGQKTGFTHFKNESIDKMFKRDILYLDGCSYSLCSPRPGKITVTPKEFIQMATTITITKDNIRNYAIQRLESKTTPKRILPSTNAQLNYYIANDLGKELLKCLGIVSNCERFPVPAGNWNLDSLLMWDQTPQGSKFWRDHRDKTRYMKDIPGGMLNDYLKQCVDSTVAAMSKPSTVLEQFLAGPIATDNKFINYVHKNNLGEEILKAIEVKSSMNRSYPYPYTSGNNIDFNLIFCWDRTPQGHDFWSRHHSKSGCSVDGGLLTKYLEAYKEARSGIIPRALEEMSKSTTYPPILVGAIYNYRTGTKYKVRHANSSKDSYTLETLSTGRTAPWCSDVTAAHIHSVFTLHTEAPSLAVKGTPITQSPICPEEVVSTSFRVGDMVRIRHDAKIHEVYGSETPITLLRAMYFSGTKKIDEIHKDYCRINGFGYAYEMIEPAVEEDLPLQIMRDAITSIKTSTAPVIGPKLDQVVDGTISMCTLSKIGTPIYFDSTAVGIGGTITAPRTIETPTKGKTMPKTLKDNAVELVQENKAAAFTAAEIKAGQIINKQAISLIKPKLPMMVRGYADSPVASVVLANVVALGLKHYAAGNKKLEKISELMIAGAAFDSIDALNIDGIVNDFIAGLKLPAGVEIE